MKKYLSVLIITLFAMTACHHHPANNNVSESNEECLLCGAPLQYSDHADSVTCVFCKRTYVSNVQCVKGHYVCDQCHTSGVDSIIHYCLHESSTSPIFILERMMSMPFCHMHGPEHHILVGAALLTAYHNAGGSVDLEQALPEMVRRGKEVPGGACGSWGACGAALSTGMFMSIVTRNTPLSDDSWRLCNSLTSQALQAISQHGGPRCCKRDSYLAIQTAVAFVDAELGIKMSSAPIVCSRYQQNNQCIGTRCPFHPGQQQPGQ